MARTGEHDGGAGQVTILVVDDEAPVRFAVAEHLSDAGFRVAEAADAAEALSVLAGMPVDLVPTGVDMPGGMDGLGLACRVRANRPATPVILTSGVPRVVAEAAWLPRDIPSVDKPYRYEALLDRIAALLPGDPRARADIAGVTPSRPPS